MLCLDIIRGVLRPNKNCGSFHSQNYLYDGMPRECIACDKHQSTLEKCPDHFLDNTTDFLVSGGLLSKTTAVGNFLLCCLFVCLLGWLVVFSKIYT